MLEELGLPPRQTDPSAPASTGAVAPLAPAASPAPKGVLSTEEVVARLKAAEASQAPAPARSGGSLLGGEDARWGEPPLPPGYFVSNMD